MSDFQSDIDSDFEAMLSDEFSVSVVFSSPGVGSQTSTGIFDNTEEEFETAEQAMAKAGFVRILIHNNSLNGFEIKEGYDALIGVKNWTVRETPTVESEGNILVILREPLANG